MIKPQSLGVSNDQELLIKQHRGIDVKTLQIIFQWFLTVCLLMTLFGMVGYQLFLISKHGDIFEEGDEHESETNIFFSLLLVEVILALALSLVIRFYTKGAINNGVVEDHVLGTDTTFILVLLIPVIVTNVIIAKNYKGPSQGKMIVGLTFNCLVAFLNVWNVMTLNIKNMEKRHERSFFKPWVWNTSALYVASYNLSWVLIDLFQENGVINNLQGFDILLYATYPLSITFRITISKHLLYKIHSPNYMILNIKIPFEKNSDNIRKDLRRIDKSLSSPEVLSLSPNIIDQVSNGYQTQVMDSQLS